MNNPLDHDFEEFEFSTKDRICKDSAVDHLQEFVTLCTESCKEEVHFNFKIFTH